MPGIGGDTRQVQFADRIVLGAMEADQRGRRRRGCSQGPHQGIGQAQAIEQAASVGRGRPGQHQLHVVGQGSQ